MKKIVLILTIILGGSIILLQSCKKENNETIVNNYFKTKLLKNNKIKNSIINSYMSLLNEKSSLNEYDFNHIYEVTDDNNNVTYVIHNKNDYSKVISAYPYANNTDFKFLKVETIIDNNIKKAKYTTLNNKETLIISFNIATQEITTEYINTFNKNSGDCTLACMQEIYGNMGWASVAGWVLGAFAPESVAAVAVGCAIGCIAQ